MDIDAYRKQCLAEIKEAPGKQYLNAKQLGTDKLAAGADGEAAVADISLDEKHYGASVRALLDLLGDPSQPAGLRRVAKRKIDTAAFRPAAFAAFQAEYTALLRKLATDPDKEIRLVSLRSLASVNDRHARKLLNESVQGTRPALVPKAEAVSLLGLDDHGSAKPILRELAVSGKGKVRQEALRALSSDPKSAGLFASVVGDKQAARAVREIAAAGLRNVAPVRFAKLARQVALDDDDDDAFRATAVSAITHDQAVRERTASPRFTKAIAAVAGKTGSAPLKASIKRYRAMVK